jgi:hypothetical protein
MNVRGIDFAFVFMIFGLDFSNIFTDCYFRCFSFCIIKCAQCNLLATGQWFSPGSHPIELTDVTEMVKKIVFITNDPS